MNDVLNNIQISAYHNSNAPIRLGLYFNAGALLQPKGKEGLSHLLEHVVANNVNNGTNEYVQAFTTKQEIYFIVVSYDSSFLKNSYEKICKIIRSGNYTNSTVQNEKLSVKNELSNIENDYPNNNQIILHDFLATKSQNTNIYGLVEGSHETLSGITLEDLRTHQKNFLQKPSSIVITGNINVNKELPSILTKPFSKFDNNEPVINRLNTSSLTENITLEDHILKTPRDTPFLGIGWSTPFIDAKTFIAQMIGLNALINPTNSYYNKTRGNLNIHDLALDHDIIFKQQVIFSIHTKISKAYIKHFISTLN
ncbi:insulinase family protein, partial [Candidatus Saccharibacteria bacterium]|nr:insulinase family protein [Candidatus Saccharibacteria bacterium]